MRKEVKRTLLRSENEVWAGPQIKELYQTMEEKDGVWKPTGSKRDLQHHPYSIDPDKDEMVKLSTVMQSPVVFQYKSVEEDMNCGLLCPHLNFAPTVYTSHVPNGNQD